VLERSQHSAETAAAAAAAIKVGTDSPIGELVSAVLLPVLCCMFCTKHPYTDPLHLLMCTCV
jgi:hypothetical protein